MMTYWLGTLKRVLPIVLLVTLLPLATVALAEDMRQLQVEARRQLLDQIAAEQQQAKAAATRSRAEITASREALRAELSRLKQQRSQLKKDITQSQNELTRMGKEENELDTQLSETDKIMRELVGVIRVNAKDLGGLVKSNLQNAIITDKTVDGLDDIGNEGRFPAMTDIKAMVDSLFRQLDMTAEVSINNSQIIDRSGQTVTAEVLLVGPFTACYRTAEETGFLTYSPSGSSLYALSKLPDSSMQSQIGAYLDGQSDDLPLDIARGAALQQLVHNLSLLQQIPKGGPIVWPIVVILAIGFLIILERTFFFWRQRLDSESIIRAIARAARNNEWQTCEELCPPKAGKPLQRVLAAGLACRTMCREDMENALQEAILREIPATERFLSTLGILAAIAPLLGLLGTVTGMIDTFHIITLYGTGDARLMSGGISEALITTMLGLSVAIPLMLGQTLLNRAADKEIGRMEEKAVALVNITLKSQLPE